MKFSDVPLTETTRKGIEAAGFETCMPVQEKVFEHSLKGGDVMVQSQTGTGKTAAFLITVLEKFARRNEGQDVKALVIVPTRELAVQIEHDAKVLAEGHSDIRIGTFYGGVGYKSQDDQLSKGVDLYIGTPGRLMDYGKARKIGFDLMDIVIIDEADRLFDMGFYPDILHMFKRMRPRESRQTLLFSATLTNRARNLAWDFMNDPVEIDIETDTITVNEIRQELFHVSKNEKFSLLLRILAKENPENAIIFTNTKSMAVEVAKRLEINGYDAHVLMGDLPQSKRLQVIQKMKKGLIKFLVATDVAARGLHVDDLGLVVNYDVPEDSENYVHRVGRTARAGKSGLAITLACEQFVYGLEGIEEYIQMKIPVLRPDDESYPPVTDKSAHMRFRDLVRSYRSDKRSPGGGRPRRPGERPQQGRSPRPHTRREKPAGNSRRASESSRPADGDVKQERPSKPESRAPQQKQESSRKPQPKPRAQSEESGTQQREPRKPERNRPQRKSQPKSEGPKPQRNERGRPEGEKSRPSAPGIEHLSFEERVAYYKKKYGGDLTSAGENRKGSSESRPKPSNRRQAPKHTDKPQKEKPEPEKAREPEKTQNPKKRTGLLSKILKRDE